jgi:hypothetical protein
VTALRNPFTPSSIASHPGDFFGRTEELNELERALEQGSLAIQGPIGIGKSSLLSMGMCLMEGYGSAHNSKHVIAVGHKGVESLDHAARLLLEAFVGIDERKSTIRFKLPKIVELESTEIVRYFKEGRHLDALNRIVEKDYLRTVLGDGAYLLLGIDEADKCPVPIAQLIRAVLTHTQHKGVTNVRFVVAGVSPFFQEMVNEDQGINRFFYRTITLLSMPDTEAQELVAAKFETLIEEAEQSGLRLICDPIVLERIVALSGGHPHILQLLGSHVVEHENVEPDGIIDNSDLLNALRPICYDDRANVYDTTVHSLEVQGKLDTLRLLLGMESDSPKEIVEPGFPTQIDRALARDAADPESIQWLVEHNILVPSGAENYTLVDEFLRIRLLFDAFEDEMEREEAELRLIESGQLDDEEFPYSFYES